MPVSHKLAFNPQNYLQRSQNRISRSPQIIATFSTNVNFIVEDFMDIFLFWTFPLIKDDGKIVCSMVRWVCPDNLDWW